MPRAALLKRSGDRHTALNVFERLSVFAASVVLFATGACTSTDSSRQATVVSVLTQFEDPLMQSRPDLVEGKFARMAQTPVDFFRGTLPLFRHDWRESGNLSASEFALASPLVNGLGDAHPENFGTLLAPDGTLTLEANDLDGADRVPYLWDVRRMSVGVALAAKVSGSLYGNAETEAATAQLAGEFARAYADALARYVAGEPLIVVGEDSPERIGNPMVEDLFRRARRDANERAELEELVETRTDGSRRFLRGILDEDEPTAKLLDVPDSVVATLPELFLRAFPGSRLGDFEFLDIVRELGSGVASWPRLRLLVLVRVPARPEAGEIIVELKETSDSFVSGWYLPDAQADSAEQRVLRSRRFAWSRPDADSIYGATEWLGVPVILRNATEAHKTLRVDRMEDDAGTVASLSALSRTYGKLLAAAHARHELGNASRVSAVIERDREAFVREQATVADSYLRVLLEDLEHFRAALTAKGPRLGMEIPPAEPARSDWDALWKGIE